MVLPLNQRLPEALGNVYTFGDLDKTTLIFVCLAYKLIITFFIEFQLFFLNKFTSYPYVVPSSVKKHFGKF